MNIVRALEVALPELPERVVRKNPPKLDPKVIFKEHSEKGQQVVLVKLPGSDMIFRFPPLNWKLIQLFDGTRSPAEIAELFQRETGSAISEEEINEVASFLQTNSPLLYKTPIERNITLQQELRSARKKRSRFHGLDFSDIIIKTWYNADAYITWLYPKVRFMFTPWFVWSTIGTFAVMGWMWADRFGEVWSDSFAFYNFTQKSGSDLIEFWLLFAALAALHETGHGLVGKHFGATIERMGFTLMYFAPSFFCDATQVWVIGGKWARIATSIAGIWVDLVACFFATVLWWGTSTGMTVHDWAYKAMMITGIGVSILNLNPLIKLDGYLIFSELVAEPSLKESSTEYLSGWIRQHIFRLPIEIPYVPRQKRTFFAVYAALSGLYSYSLLSFLMVLTYHILKSFTPEWAFLPASAIGFWVFRARIRALVKFMKILYLDKKERARAWFTPVRIAITATAALLVLFLPLWPDFVQGQFVLFAGRTAVLHAEVPGSVTSVPIQEGQTVSPGITLAQLRNSDLESHAAKARQELTSATALATQAELRYVDVAEVEQERRHSAENDRLLRQELQQLSITSPISGIVTTPHVADLIGRSVEQGALLLELADVSEMRAQVYIPEFAMRDIRPGEPVRLLARGQIRPVSGVLSLVSPTSVEVAAGLVSKDQLQGISPPRYYLGSVLLKNDGKLMPGMTGSAKILTKKRSLVWACFRFMNEFTQRKIW